MKTVLINYAHNTHFHAQRINSDTGLRIGGFDQVISYKYEDIDEEFKTKNQHILSQRRGAGYWIWKPYFIKKTLESLEDGDIVFYCDSGAEFILSAKPLIELCKTRTKGVLPFHMEPVDSNKEVLQTKKDTFVLMECDGPEYTETWARLGGFSVWEKNIFSLEVVNTWLTYVQDERIVTDLPNQCGVPEDPRFIDHRHDQSVFSLLTKKYGIQSYTDPSQWGNEYRKPSDGYNQIINSTRYNG